MIGANQTLKIWTYTLEFLNIRTLFICDFSSNIGEMGLNNIIVSEQQKAHFETQA